MKLHEQVKSLAQLRRTIQKRYPHLNLVRSPSGYYYWVSGTDNELACNLNRLNTTSVMVFSFSQLTLEQWMQEADLIMKKASEEK